MSREIKFRAWDKVYKHFHEQDLIRDYVIGEFIDNPEYEVTQYTGLKDKYGVEIYEADIVEFKHSSEREYDAIGKVEYIQQWCGFYFSNNRRLNSNMNIKVLGNIYENLNLLSE